MPPALSVDLRGRVVGVAGGPTQRPVAKRFGLGGASAVRWHERSRLEPERSAFSHGLGGKQPFRFS